MGRDDHRAAPSAGELPTQPLELARQDLTLRAAVAIDGVEREDAQGATDVGGVVQQAARIVGQPSRGAQTRDELCGAELAPAGIGRDAALRSQRRTRQDRADRGEAIPGRGRRGQHRAPRQLRHGAVAARDRLRARVRWQLALDEQVVVSDERQYASPEPAGAKRALGAIEQPRVSRCVDVRAVEERVGVAGALRPVVAARADVGSRDRAAQDGQQGGGAGVPHRARVSWLVMASRADPP